MQRATSIYATELTLRGFHLWDEETVGQELGNRLRPSLVPAFLWVAMRSLIITFAYDEQCVVWAAEGMVDLSELGFTELELTDDERPRFLN